MDKMTDWMPKSAVAVEDAWMPKSAKPVQDDNSLNMFPSAKRKSIGEILTGNLKGAAQETYREGISPILSGISTAGFGIPKAVAEAQGNKENIYPEQQTLSGKILRGISESIGFLYGGAAKVGENIAGGAVKKIASETLGRRTGREAVRWGIASMLQTPQEGIKRPVETIPQRVVAGGVGAIAGAGGELIPAGVQKIAPEVKKLYERAKASYLTSKVAPVADKIFKSKLAQFSEGVQKLFRIAKVPDSAIADIKTKGTEAVLKRSAELGDNTDTIYQRIEQGFDNKEKLADTAYSKAMSQTPTGWANKINIGNTEDKIRVVLSRYGMINQAGKHTQLAESPAMLNSQIKKLLDIYDSLKLRITAPGYDILTIPQMERFLKTGVSRDMLAREIPLTKDQYTLLRDNLNALYKETPTDRNISEIMGVFYQDGENAGLKGLQEARRLQREHFQAMDKFTNKNTGQIKGFGERTLDRFHSLTGDQKRSLQEIANYIGDKNLLSDLSDINSAKHINQIAEKYDTKYFETVLNGATDRAKTESVRTELRDLLGTEEGDELINEVIQHRRARIGYKLGAGAGLIGTEEILRKRVFR